MKRYIKHITLAALLLLMISCSKGFLDYTPKGVLTSDQLNTPDNLDKMVTAAYASLGNDDWTVAFSHMWIWGSVRSDDAYKGGGSVGDQGEIDLLEQFVAITTDGNKPNLVWVACFEGIGRANDALRRIMAADPTTYPNQMAREAECRFLRGHWYFLLKELFKRPPYFDESVPKDQIKTIANNLLTNDQLWDKIAEDFQFAIDNLPATQSQVGRANKVIAQAYLAKVRLFQAYEQNDQNAVTNINTAKLQQVVDLTNAVISSGKYGLNDDYAKNFLTTYDNSRESVFAVQFSYDDGSASPGRINKATGLNYDMESHFGCCDFHNPSQNMVNAFRTDASGLPLLDTYNDVVIKDSIDFRNKSVDPRLDHTVGINTHPFKYLPTWIMKPSWRRAPFVYGTYSTMKEVTQYTDPSLRKYGAFLGCAMNFTVIRYDDVLLWQAEALIELNRWAEALPLINQVRLRAKNSTGLLKYSNGVPISNYNTQPYVDGVNCNWTQDYARKALRFERRLEFGMEGARFFDLVRWGIAAETLNQYFSVEKNRYVFLAKAKFTKGRDEYLYIPQIQINLVNGLYTQNNGW